MESLNLFALKDRIEIAFKSLIKSGRPDIRDENNKDLIPQLYVDLYDGDYLLKQALDDNHVLFKGRKGTGKSTIFLQAENIIRESQDRIPIYVNLQSCYEEIKTANSDQQNNELTKYKTYCNFFTHVIYSMRDSFHKSS